MGNPRRGEPGFRTTKVKEVHRLETKTSDRIAPQEGSGQGRNLWSGVKQCEEQSGCPEGREARKRRQVRTDEKLRSRFENQKAKSYVGGETIVSWLVQALQTRKSRRKVGHV